MRLAANKSLFKSLLATFFFELSSAESLIFESSVNLLNPFIVSIRMTEEIRLSFSTSVFSLGVLVVTGGYEIVRGHVIGVTLFFFRFCHDRIDYFSKFIF